MSNLSPVEFEQLKSLISRRTLSTGEQTITLDILRSKFPNFFSNLGLTEANLKDDKFLIKYLTESHNRNKIIEALKKELSLSSNQLVELIAALETKPVVAEEVGGEVSRQGVSGQQEVPVSTTTGTSTGGMPGMPSGPSISPAQRRIYRIPHAPEPPKPEIHIANKSGYVTEAGDASKLVRATSSGAVVEKPPSKIFVAEKGGVREHAIKPSGRFKFPSAFSNLGKNIGSKMGVFIKRNLTPMRLGTLVSGGIGAVAGAGFGPMGSLTGGIGGGLMPSWLRSGGGRKFFGKLGNGAINATARLTNPASKMAMPPIANKWVLLFLGGFVLLVLGLALFAPASTPPDASLPGGGSTAPVNLASCKFTRAGTSTQFQSPLLLSFIQEAAQKSSIPPAVLAAFIRVESPASSGMSDEQISNYSANCAESGTKALGIMQIQPPGTTSARGDPASCDDCIDAGARLVGKTVSTMTREDYCDPRTSIIVGSGWILKKMSFLGYGDGTKWDPLWTNNKEAITALVNTYYGCLNYGGAADCTGPYNYADDVSTSLQNCQTASAPGTNIFNCPVRGGKVSYGSKEKGEHCSPSYVQQYGSQGCNPGEAGYTGRDTAVDIAGGTSPYVYLPTINGQKVTWNVAEASKTITDAEGGGQDFVATAFVGGKQYRIRFVHLESIPSDLTLGSQAESDRKIGEYYKNNPYGAHVHVTIQENGEFKPVDTYFNLCQ